MVSGYYVNEHIKHRSGKLHYLGLRVLLIRWVPGYLTLLRFCIYVRQTSLMGPLLIEMFSISVVKV